jgi:hypothetical protein
MNNIVILGNGFDLSLGFKTTFQDFVKGSHEFRFEATKSPKNLEKTLFSGLLDISSNSWVDFEVELGSLASDPDVLFNEEDFDLFKTMLINYLDSLKYGAFNSSSNAYKFMRTVFKTGQEYLILNFNYTPTFMNTLSGFSNYMQVVGSSKFINLHGSIGRKNIVVGVDDKLILNTSKMFLRKAFTKNFKRLNLKSELLTCKNIFFFGHSLGETDHPRIEAIFHHILNNIGDPINFILVYHGSYDRLYKHKMLDLLTGNNLTKFKESCNFIEFDSEDKNVDFSSIEIYFLK